jgi:hypothetical protein
VDDERATDRENDGQQAAAQKSYSEVGSVHEKAFLVRGCARAARRCPLDWYS